MTTSDRAIENVLIVGGGVGGLSLAIALLHEGVKVKIVDLNPHPKGSGIGIGPSGLRLLDRYGLARKLVEVGTASNGILYTDGEGDPIADLAYVAESGSGLPSNVTLSREALAGVLLQAALEAGAVMHEGITVDRIEETTDGVIAHLSNDSVAEADLLVGADGAYSRVRELIFPETPKPTYVGQGVWRWMVPNTIGLTKGWTLKGATTKLGLYPLPGDIIYAFLMLSMERNEWIDAERSRHMVSTALAEYSAPEAKAIASQLIGATDYIYRPLETVFVEDWTRGRVVLIGDAAHTMPPHLASGGVMAVEDGIVLAQELCRSIALPEALAAFMKRRYTRAKYIYETSIALSKIEQDKGIAVPDYSRIRGEALQVLGQPV